VNKLIILFDLPPITVVLRLNIARVWLGALQDLVDLVRIRRAA
jgi:hypothetical protein